nr:anti-sigma28 factor (negative regulator of flagellin synthesis) [Mucilaginibacter sp. X5P1]
MLYKAVKKRRAFRTSDKLRKTYKRASQGQIKVYFEQVDAQTGNEKFLSELIEYIKQNISNPNLSVETTSREMKMCR